MNKSASKIKKDNIYSSYKNIIIFAILVFLFHLFFTRLFLKMDDGHFLGIVNSPEFTYAGWLKSRYETVSGRTVGEFLLSFFLRHNIIFWKILNSAMIVYIVHFFIRLTSCFTKDCENEKRELLCIFAMFTMFVSCLNPSVFWYAGSFSYLWPFAGAIFTVSPLVFYILENKISSTRLFLSCISALLGTMQEQSAALCTAFYLILLFIILVKGLRLKVTMFLPLIPIFLCDFFLFTCPGAKGRNIMEAGAQFKQYTDYSLLQKLECGLSTFFANSFYLSNFLILVFIALLSIAIYQYSKKNKALKVILISANIFSVLSCVFVNYLCSALGHGLAHMIFRSAFYTESFTAPFYILFVTGVLLSIMILFMIIHLIIENRKLGITIGLCIAAGFFASLAMSFSPTVFSSGQRVAFFTNMLVITSVLILFSNLENTKLKSILEKCFIGYALITIAVDCFAFRLIELPLMG